MSELIHCINDQARYRTVFAGATAGRKYAVVCYQNETAVATNWAMSHFEGSSFLVVSIGPKSSLSLVDTVAAHPEISIVVFGRQCRKKALELARHGIREFQFAEDQRYKNIKHDPRYLKRNHEKLEEVFSHLSDDESKRTFASVVKHRITGDHGYLRIASYPEYEHPLVSAQPGEWVCDCGAANGATSFRFAKQVGESGKVYAFEPDPANIAKIKASQGRTAGKVEIVNCAVSDQRGTMRFESNKGGASRLSDRGDVEVSVNTLDHFASEHKLKGAGLLSFDVEGFERAAMTGGLSLMRNLRPKLQISIYHKQSDLFELPLWVLENLGDHRLFIGHHDSYHCETDLYALPAKVRPLADA